MKRDFKRVLVVSDLHCGHRVGLTPPEYNSKCKQDKFDSVRAAIWNWWSDLVDRLMPIDIVFANGDLIDGDGNKSAGVELIEGDRNKQARMAGDCLTITRARTYVLTFGTPYHTGRGEDFEENVAERLERGARVKIGSHEWPSVNGLVFDLKHKVGSSGVPHGRATPIAREALWAQLWADAGEAPRADILIRSHVHYHVYMGGADRPLAMTTPALQGMGSKYGARECSGRVHVGAVHFDVSSDGSYTWQAHIAKLPQHRAQITRL